MAWPPCLPQEPGLRWWQRRRVRPAAPDDLQRLRALEALLSAEEVAHFRQAGPRGAVPGLPAGCDPPPGRSWPVACQPGPLASTAHANPAAGAAPPCRYGVAAVHSARLAACPALRQFVADKLDCIVYNRGQLSPALLEQLLHLDQPAAAPAPPPPTAAAESGSAGAADASSTAEAERGFGLRVAVSCPKLGVALSMRNPAAAPAPPAAAGRLAYVQLTLHAISAELEPSGGRLLGLGSCVCVGGWGGGLQKAACRLELVC